MKKLIKKYFEIKESDKIIFFLTLTTIFNIGSFIFKFTMGVIIPSIWFSLNALFYFVGILARAVSVQTYQKVRLLEDEKMKNKIGYKNYYHNGLLLILLGLTYFGVSLYMILHPTFNNIKGYMVYAVAFQAFVSLGVSIYGMVKYKRNKSPVLSAVKNTNFCNALTSIVLTQVVLLDNFGGDAKYETLNGLTGILAAALIIFTGIFMTIGIKKFMKKEGF